MKVSSLVRIVFFAGWPFVIYFGLKKFEPRHLALFILLLLLLRKGSFRKFKVLKLADWFILVTTFALAIGIYWSNSETLLRLYPVVVSLGLLTVFALSLFHPPTIIERIARIDHPNLSPDGVRYTMHVTRVWCVFFLCNALAATGTALYASREVWVFYNGFLSYLLIAIIFCSEWLIRQRYLHQRESA
jgi:uncharacterized membrane protein